MLPNGAQDCRYARICRSKILFHKDISFPVLLYTRLPLCLRSPIVDKSAPRVVQTVPWNCMITAEGNRIRQ
jgi:hypothetical protein